MGNSATKEQRSPPLYQRSHAGRSGSSHQSPTSPDFGQDGPQVVYSSRHGRGGRSEISTLFGIPNSHDRDGVVVETRRETKAEREARRLERDRRNREIERERSMKEESVDGGYLVTQGVYTGIEDYNKAVVRQLMIERRIAPFWRGLNDHSDSWTEHQLVAAARGLPIPAADEIPQSPPSATGNGAAKESTDAQSNNHLAVPIPGQSSAANVDGTLGVPTTMQNSSLPNSASPSSGSALLRGRAKTLASLTTSSRNVSQSDLQPREINLPRDPHVNGQPVEAYLYKDAAECPICFLYYPPHLNRTRCCDQPICSECFVQIKRPDPHPPEHADPSQPQAEEAAAQDPESLVSEPAACPYCVQPEFGVTFDPLPFKRGLAYASQGGIGGAMERPTPPMSSSSSLASLPQSGQLSPQPTTGPKTGRKRGSSLSASSPHVITTDRIRPDWANKLASARAHAARRSAAATALHTAAYLMGGRNGQGEQSIPRFGRRTLLRRGGSDSPSNGSPSHTGMLGMDRYGTPGREDSEGNSGGERSELASPTISGPPRQSSRRTRVEDLEEMMMMEAIRLSLASEEERRRKEEKEAKKEAKRKEKEDKKAEKAAKKTSTSFYPSSANQSVITLGSPSSASLNTDPTSTTAAGKGKAVARDAGEGSQNESAQQHLERSRAQILPSPTTSTGGSTSASASASADPGLASSPYRPSHLRTLSTASSSDGIPTRNDSPERPTHLTLAHQESDGVGSVGGSVPPTPPGGGAGIEPMFNFRSLTEMVEREGVPLMEHDVLDGDREKEGREENEKAGGKGGSSDYTTESARECVSGHNLSELREKGGDEKLSDGQKEKEDEPQSPEEFVDAPSEPEASRSGDLGKAHEIAIERNEERREQGSV